MNKQNPLLRPRGLQLIKSIYFLVVFLGAFFAFFEACTQKPSTRSTRDSKGSPTKALDVLPPEQVEYYKNLSLGELLHLVEDSSANIVKGKKVEFKKVLLVNDDKNTEVGNPTVEGALVEGLVLDNIKDRKILVFKKRRRQNSRKKYGHRQHLSKIQITKILSKGGKVISEIEDKKMSLSKEQKSDKKTVKKKEVVKKKK